MPIAQLLLRKAYCTMKIHTMQLLPPAKHLCQQCAHNHSPEQPHNPQTLYYAVWFQQNYGRSPTWNDAMAHCSEEVRAEWIAYLTKLGIDPDNTNLKGDIKTQADVKHLLPD